MGVIHEIQPPRTTELADRLIFKTIWDIYPHKSFLTGLWLRTYENTKLFQNCFAYILPIKKYPYYRHYLKNLILMTPGENGLYRDGTEEERIQYALSIEEQSRGESSARWDILKAMGEELAKEYPKHFPTTRGLFINYQYNLKERTEIMGTINRRFLNSLRK